MSVEAGLASALKAARAAAPFQDIVVAVSGGGDSMALLRLVHLWAEAEGAAVRAITVDHGLRPEAADEARMVAETCGRLGIAHETLRWDGWNGQGNLPAMARDARYDLIASHVAGSGARNPVILLGHTADDAAETFLMRLARGSGVDGLARMRMDWRDRGLRWLRPLLSQRRAALRDWLRAQGVDWAEDPTNEDEHYERARIRKALALLEPLGIGVVRLVETADAMTAARQALEHWAVHAARETIRIEAGDVVFDEARLAALPEETRDRLLAQAIMWVSGATYRPRRSGLREVQLALTGADRATLGGCLLARIGGDLHIMRELNAVAGCRAPAEVLWDGRWRLIAPQGADTGGLELRALNAAGLTGCPDWRDAGLPRDSLLAGPAVFRGDLLVAAPLAGLQNGWSAELSPPGGDFFTSLLSH